MKHKGISKYNFGPEIVLGSSSFAEAQKKIISIKKKYYNKTNIKYFYYNKKDALWIDAQFLFLCTFIEFRLSELLAYLHDKNLIKKSYILKLNRKYGNKIPKSKTMSINERIFTPRGLLEILGYGLGKFIEILEQQTKNFNNKEDLISKLKTFKKHRNAFIHHSFGSGTDIDYTLRSGMKKGKELITLFDSYE